MKDGLDGLVALVTGAGGGIGSAIAVAMANSGAKVAVEDLDFERAKMVSDSICQSGGIAIDLSGDISIESERKRIVDQVSDRLGSVDILVNNAADHGIRHQMLEVDESEWNRIIATNLTAAFSLAKLVAPKMMEKARGSIVNLAAIQASLPVATYLPYVSSKGGILSLTKALAVELGAYGIRVNALSPGAIETPSTNSALDELASNKKAPTLLGRMGNASEVAKAAVFLAGADSSFITGVNLVVDGGRSLSRESDPFAGFSERS